MILGWISLLRLGNLPFPVGSDVAVWGAAPKFSMKSILKGRKKKPGAPFWKRTETAIVLLIFYKNSCEKPWYPVASLSFLSFSKKNMGDPRLDLVPLARFFLQ